MDHTLNSTLVDTQGWDAYWNKKNNGGILYALVAEFYRKVIIRPHLNRMIRKYFSPGAELIHAGCGSGQVDVDITPFYNVTGFDISKKALEIYRESNSNRCKTVHGSILDMRLEKEQYEGVYNLGVMEHFDADQIQVILTQFRNILKRDGKIVLFWPPEYGLSVLFFKGLRFIIKSLTGKDVKFHPDEIARIRSKKDAQTYLNKAGFEMIEYCFGPKDVFTYSVVVGKKIS